MTATHNVKDAAEAAVLAARLLGCGPSEMVTAAMPEGRGWCTSQRTRGGGTLLVAPDGSVLFVPSAQRGDPMAAFRRGERTPQEAFHSGSA